MLTKMLCPSLMLFAKSRLKHWRTLGFVSSYFKKITSILYWTSEEEHAIYRTFSMGFAFMLRLPFYCEHNKSTTDDRTYSIFSFESWVQKNNNNFLFFFFLLLLLLSLFKNKSKNKKTLIIIKNLNNNKPVDEVLVWCLALDIYFRIHGWMPNRFGICLVKLLMFSAYWVTDDPTFFYEHW